MTTMTLASTGALLAGVAMTALAFQPAAAQYGDNRQAQYQDQNRGQESRYDDAYRTGYRAGYEAARNRTQYDDNIRRGDGRDANNGTSDQDLRWRQRYARTYTYNDDSYYQQCRQSPDPAGVIAGALIGGLLGNTASRGNGGATIAGVILGGATGAALTRNLDCQDRSYAYKTYYDGFNSGRANSTYKWRNPANGHYGTFHVESYANDPDGFRCANYNQELIVNGRLQTSTGQACRQPDGAWAIVS